MTSKPTVKKKHQMTATEQQQNVVERYYRHHREELVAFVAGSCGLPAESEDMVQDLFLKLCDSERPLTEVTLPSFVYTMLRNMAIDHWRRRCAVRQYEQRFKAAALYNNVDDRLVTYSPWEVTELFERGVARLTEKQRTAYVLNVVDGLRVSEISDRLGEKYKSVENRLGVARKVVRGYFKRMLA